MWTYSNNNTRSELFQMDKLKLIQETIAMSQNIKSDFLSKTESVFYTDSRILDILLSEFDCMESIVILLEKEKFEDCFILLRHVFETFLYFWLMLEGKIYRLTRVFKITPNPGNTKKEARDRTFEKWINEWKSGDVQYKNVKDIVKGKEYDEIIVTYEYEGLYSSEDPERTKRLLPFYVFAFEDYDPETRFLAHLPTICPSPIPKYREIMKNRQREQKILYHRYFYFRSILDNLIINNLISKEQADRIIVHYNFFSSFLHPNKRIIRTDKFTFSSPTNQKEVFSELVLLYLCRLQYLYLIKTIKHFKRYYPKGRYSKYEQQVELLDASSKELWFFDNEPLDYDIKVSDMKKWWLKRSGQNVDENYVFYYTDPVERLKQIIAERSSARGYLI